MTEVTLLQTFTENGMQYLKGSVIRVTPAAQAAWAAKGYCAPGKAPSPAPTPDA